MKKWPGTAIGTVIGAGRAFCVGESLMDSEESELSRDTYENRTGCAEQELSWLLYSIPKVTIAVINGHAMGAGLAIALACDLRIASDKAKFGAAYAKVGLGGDFGISWFLTHYVGAPKAKELLFLCETIDADEAYRIGLVNRVARDDVFQDAAGEFALQIAHGAQTSFRYMKANVNLSMMADLRTVLDREAETHLRCGKTEDFQEGVLAFMEKRAPKFTGRTANQP